MNPIRFPTDIFYLLAQQDPGVAVTLSQTDQRINTIVNEIYTDAVQFIIKESPSLNHHLESTNKIQQFMELVGELQTEVQRLNGEELSASAPLDSITKERMLEGYFHYRNLVQEVSSKTQIAQKEDFKKFVQAVADELGRQILPDESLEDVWTDLQKNDLIEGVTNLNLSKKEMKFLPPEIALLKNLKTLYLDNNHVKTLPEELISLSQLEHIKLNSNKLEVISNNLKLPQLKFFELRNNNLKEVPNLTSYPNLKVLYLHSNQITAIPDNIDSHQDLSVIYLKNNPIKDIPNPLPSRLELSTPPNNIFSSRANERFENF